MRKRTELALLTVFIFIFFVPSVAQKTTCFDDPQFTYNTGIELFNKEKYGSARDAFEKVIAMIKKEKGSSLLAEAEYYQAICAYELFHSDASYLFSQYMLNHPEYSRIDNVFFYAANLYYRNKNYRDALRYYNKIDINKLDEQEETEFYYKKGYCHLHSEEFYQARKEFEKILNRESIFRAPVNYYHAHLAYLDGDYEKALEGFNRLSEDESFGKIVPYYTITIDYILGRYKNVTDNAYLFEQKDSDRRLNEIQRLIAISYFKQNKYHEAIPWFEKVISDRKPLPAEIWYQCGYSYYSTGDYQKALSALQKVTAGNDSLAQNAYFLIGDCYLKTDQKKFASGAFLSAYKMDYNRDVKEEALFNYAKLAYELSFDPYNEAIKALKQFITDFPESKRKDEASEYLVDLFLSTNNYSEALKTLDLIENRDHTLKPAMQRIAHFHGIELFNNGNYEDAIANFKKSLDYNYDDLITSANYFWLGESYYRLKKTVLSEDYFKKFRSLTVSKELEYFSLADYNLGYIYYDRNEYRKALSFFKNYATGNPERGNFQYDASLRIADCYMVLKEYDHAIEYYDKARKSGGKNDDYALFQMAMAYGGKGMFQRKIDLLGDLPDTHKASVYNDRALYEAGITYQILNRDEEALANFTRLINTYASSGFIKESLLKTGLIYYNRNENNMAISTLKKVIEQYPGTGEAREALESLRNIYVDMNQVDEYFTYAGQFSYSDISDSEQDSLTFLACENLYMEGKCIDVIECLNDYISRYPQGVFHLTAYAYKADCEYRMKEYDKALSSYRYIIEQPVTDFTGTALVRSSLILFDRNNYEVAVTLFSRLEKVAGNNQELTLAIAGQMRCHYYLGNDAETIEKARQLISSGFADDELAAETYFLKAKAEMNESNIQEAINDFRMVCDKNQGAMAAESQFNIAYLNFVMEDFNESEKQTFALINTYPNFDYWVAKGFILLADIYVKQDNLFQAKHTLQSIIDNYDGEDLVMIAKNKMASIIETQNNQTTDEEVDEEIEENYQN